MSRIQHTEALIQRNSTPRSDPSCLGRIEWLQEAVSNTLSESVQASLLELWDQNICPNCGKTIPQGTRVGSGRKSEGGFCSLDCYTGFYQLQLTERARRLTARTKRKES